MTRTIVAMAAVALLGGCGDDTGGGTSGGETAGGEGGGQATSAQASTGSGNATPAFRAAVEAFCDAGCACTSCTEADGAECIEAYLAYETPDDQACSEAYISAFECATERQAACDEQPVASLQACEPPAIEACP